ncbi:hypothetical protein [Rhizobium sp. C1]|uniref:hypothetical protein n=1 Tax=Rhizobium sp. C1 TaxID=1349799 RepID=UPI001E601C0A|nr:hypothetical protein [Rhizobium sp. C1]MCD2176820.1 hypothetical protein [Rhizobium sp. C1]
MAQDMIDSAPVLSAGLVRKTVIGAIILGSLTVGLSLAGKWYGKRIAVGEYSASTAPVDITIGPDRLSLPQNVIRFPEQRFSGKQEQINLALQWPEMKGYDAASAHRFFDISDATSLIFLQMSQSIMTRDMSGRVGPIYSRLFDGPAEQGPAGLSLHRFRQGSGYGDEVLLTDPNGGAEPYAVRCVLPASPSQSTGADCQRDVIAGSDLSVQYRFSANLLKDWKRLDDAVRAYAAAHLAS